MEQVENPVSSGSVSGNSDPQGTIEQHARDLGRKVDSASARLHSSWDGAASQVKDKLGTTKSRVKAKLNETGSQAKHKLVKAKAATAEKAHDYRITVEHKVQAHPLKSLGVAFGAGALLGLMLRRRR